MDAKQVTTPEVNQEKAGRLVQTIEAAFQEKARKGSENTLLTLAYSTDP